MIDVSSCQLLIHTPTGNHRLPLTGDLPWRIGRGHENEVILKDPLVSRKHAVIKLLQSQAFYLIDLGSQNGSFVNGQRVTVPIRLRHGDRIRFGKTELQWHGPEVSAVSSGQPASPKTVLMILNSGPQGNIWQELLESQGLQVLWEPLESHLPTLIEKLASQDQGLPDLLLLDIEKQDFNPYQFCGWCTAFYPQLQIVLTSSKRREISSLERRWALRQGAVAALTAFPDGNLLVYVTDIVDQVKVVLQALGQVPLHQEALFSALVALQAVIPDDEPTSLFLEPYITGSVPSPNAAN